MKPSSRRTVSLIWSRLQASYTPLACSQSPLQFRYVVTTAPTDPQPRIPTGTVPKSRFSTAMLAVADDDDSEVEIPPIIHKKLKNLNGAAMTNNAPAMRRCTCGYEDQKLVQNHRYEPLPPPLPQPVYSVHKRLLPDSLTALSSPQGRRYLQESMALDMAESYWALTEQFVNQSDPAYCGVTTLLMVLNAMNVDPNSRWKGGWRYYGDENVLLQRCCLNAERIRRVGITMEQFAILGTCHGMRITLKRPAVNSGASNQSTPHYSLEDFRADIRGTLDSRINTENSMLVTSFSRAALQQTGDGHFSPIAAYHEESDQVLILDVARFKYAPYWVGVEELYRSQQALDEATQMPRGWFIMKPPAAQHTYVEMKSEDRRPANLVPSSSQEEACPVGKIKVQFCRAKNDLP